MILTGKQSHSLDEVVYGEDLLLVEYEYSYSVEVDEIPLIDIFDVNIVCVTGEHGELKVDDDLKKYLLSKFDNKIEEVKEELDWYLSLEY